MYCAPPADVGRSPDRSTKTSSRGLVERHPVVHGIAILLVAAQQPEHETKYLNTLTPVCRAVSRRVSAWNWAIGKCRLLTSILFNLPKGNHSSNRGISNPIGLLRNDPAFLRRKDKSPSRRCAPSAIVLLCKPACRCSAKKKLNCTPSTYATSKRLS